MAVSSLKLAIAFLAPKVLRMHALAVEGDVLANNGLFTLSANAGRGLEEHRLRGFACYAERLAFVLFVGFSAQLSATTVAIKVIWMICATHSINASVCDRFHAERTLGAKQFVVVIFAVRTPVHFEEVSAWKGPAALRAYEMLSVPLLIHRVHDGPNNHLSASSTRGAMVSNSLPIRCMCGDYNVRSSSCSSWARGHPRSR